MRQFRIHGLNARDSVAIINPTDPAIPLDVVLLTLDSNGDSQPTEIYPSFGVAIYSTEGTQQFNLSGLDNSSTTPIHIDAHATPDRRTPDERMWFATHGSYRAPTTYSAIINELPFDVFLYQNGTNAVPYMQANSRSKLIVWTGAEVITIKIGRTENTALPLTIRDGYEYASPVRDSTQNTLSGVLPPPQTNAGAGTGEGTGTGAGADADTGAGTGEGTGAGAGADAESSAWGWWLLGGALVAGGGYLAYKNRARFQ